MEYIEVWYNRYESLCVLCMLSLMLSYGMVLRYDMKKDDDIMMMIVGSFGRWIMSRC